MAKKWPKLSKNF